VLDPETDRRLGDILSRILETQKALEPVKRRAKYQTGILRDYRRKWAKIMHKLEYNVSVKPFLQNWSPVT